MLALECESGRFFGDLPKYELLYSLKMWFVSELKQKRIVQ